MAHAEKCPVCNGLGRVTPISHDDCHGCYGKGWITVDDPQPSYFPFQPPQIPVNPPCYTPYWRWDDPWNSPYKIPPVVTCQG